MHLRKSKQRELLWVYLHIYLPTASLGKEFEAGLPMWFHGKESTCQHRICRRHGFDPWVRKIPWCRKCQPAAVFLPEISHGQRILVSYNPEGRKELDMTVHTHIHTQTHGINTYTPLCIKQIINKDLMQSTRNYTQYLVITYNGKESEKRKRIYVHIHIRITLLFI